MSNPLMLISQCATTAEVTIVSQSSSNVILNVSGLLNDQLGVNQAICGVRLVFKHNQLENLRMTLVSPEGQRVILVGPGRINASVGLFQAWNVTFVPCAVPNAPDAGIAGVWDNGEPWGSFTNFSGIYHPFSGCLEDFNQGSANGSWVLEIENLGEVEGVLEYFELIFCDSTGSSCEECFLFAGDFNFSSPGGIYTFCESDPASDQMQFQLFQDSIINSQQDYTFIYTENDSVVKYADSPNEISDLPPGIYEVCGMAYQKSSEDIIFNQTTREEIDSLYSNRLYCGDLTFNCLTLRILEVPTSVEIDTIFCQGDSLFYRDLIFTEDVDTVLLVANLLLDQCDSIIHLQAKKIIPEAEISAGDSQVQCGLSIFLNGNNSQVNEGNIELYSWFTNDGLLENDIGPIAEISSGGNYYLSAVSNGCVSTDSIFIENIDTFEFEIIYTPPICFQDSFVIELITNPTGAQFDFNGPSNVNEVNPNTFFTYEEGTYNITSNLGTCERIDVLNLEHQATEITIDVSHSVIDCINPESEVIITTNVINPAFEFIGPQNLTSNLDTVLLQESGFYNLIINDENNCSKSVSFEIIEESEDPFVNVEDLSINCGEDVPMFFVEVLSPFDSVRWIGPDNFSSTQLTPFPMSSGLYEIEVFGTNGCTTTSGLEFEIVNVPFDIELLGGAINCANSEVMLCHLNENIASLNWIFNNQIISNDSCILVDMPGDYLFEGTDVNNCSNSLTINVPDLNSEINANINALSGTEINCNNLEIALQADVNGNIDNLIFSWILDGTQISDQTELIIQDAGQVELFIEDTISLCTYSETLIVEEIEDSLSNINFLIVDPICFGEVGSIKFENISGSIDFDVFLNGNLVLNESDLENLIPGQYTLELIDENGCQRDTSFEISEGRQLVIDLGDDITAVYGEEIEIEGMVNIPANEIIDFNWNIADSLNCNNCLNPTLNAYKNEEIILEITDEFGCKALDTLSLTIDNEVNYFVPNIFSPNNDGNNDFLSLYLSDGKTKVFDFRILDRWGNLVLFRPEISEENDFLIWDGYSNGIAVVQGVYVYVAKLLLIDGTETLITGNITVVR